MNAHMFASGSVKGFQYLLWVLIISIFTLQHVQAAPVVVSVDHRVTVSYSKPQFDAKKGIYSVKASITNRSGAALLSPLQLSFEGAALKNLRIKNAKGVGKNGRPYFEFGLPKGMLLAMASTEPIKVDVAVMPDKSTKRGDEKASLAALNSAQHVTAGVEVAPLEPISFPNVMTVGQGKANVIFIVPMVGDIASQTAVYLRRVGDRESIAMNDKGKDGDLVANDRTFGATILVDTNKLKPDTCEEYEVIARIGSAEVNSPATKLCVSNFPVRIAASDTAHPLLLPDGSKAVTDELIIIVKQNTSEDAVRRLADGINAKVVGSNRAYHLYQLKLPAPISAGRMIELVGQMATHAEVEGASPSGIGSYASSDTYYSIQDGLQKVRAQDVWGAGVIGSDTATGLGVTVTVLDTGIDRQHHDFGALGDCQLADNDCGSLSTDIAANFHGTRMAGIIAAKANNTIGVAGVAYKSKVHSIVLGTAAGGYVTMSLQQMIDAFDGTNTNSTTSRDNSARTYIRLHPEAAVINTSFSGGPFGAIYNSLISQLCAAIQNTVVQPDLLTSVPTRFAVVVNSAGNNNNLDSLGAISDNFYPARCNNHASLTNKELLITVANSVSSVPTSDCLVGGSGANNVEDALCEGNTTVTPKIGGSNYGNWVDIAAPGSAILAPTTTCPALPAACFTDIIDGSHYAPGTGTSESAAIVSGAAAILISCGVPHTPSELDTILSQIETTLKTSANMPVHYPAYTLPYLPYTAYPAGTTPRLDIYRALHINEPTANMTTPRTYIEDTPINLANDIVISGLNGCASVTVTLHLSDPAVGSLSAPSVAGATWSFNSATGDWIATGSVAAVNALLAGVSFNPTHNYNGNFTIVTTVNDGFWPAITGTKSITGTAVNDPPSFVKGADQSVVEDTGTQNVANWATVISAGAPDEAGQILTFNISPNSPLFSTQPAIDPLTGALTYTPAAGATGSATFTVVLVDDGGGANTSAPQSFVITMTHKLTGLPSIFPTIPPQRKKDDVVTAVTGGLSDVDCPTPPPLNPASGVLCTTGQCDLAFQWMSSAASGVPGDPIPQGSPSVSTSDSTYTLRSTDVGRYMSLCVSTGRGLDCSIRCSDNDAIDVGDPHITTVDGLHYDFQSAGEFVALRGANGMEIQVRQTAVSTAPPLPDAYTGLTSGVSVNSAVATRVGKHRVTYQPDTSPNAASNAFVLRVDGKPTPLPAGGIDLGDGGRVLPQASGGIQIDFPDQTTLMVSTSPYTFYNASWIHFYVFHTPAHEGIMGARSKGSWLPSLSNGSALGAMPVAKHDRYVDLYMKFADSWRVNKETSLFDYVDGTPTATFTNKKWPTENGPYVTGNRPVAKPLGLKAAQLACRDVVGKNEKADCVFDVRVMGHADIAKGHLLTQQIRAGLTSIFVRDDRAVSKDKEMVTFTATVARHAALSRAEAEGKGIPTGTVQFTINGTNVGEPIKLDAKGQAMLKLPRLKVEKLKIGARFIPAKGSVFFASSSIEMARVIEDVKQ